LAYALKAVEITYRCFAPPLIITKDQIDWEMEQIRPVLAA